MSAILKFDFHKRKQLRFSEVNYLNYTKKDPILHVTTTFFLKQEETRTNSVPIPHPLRISLTYLSSGVKKYKVPRMSVLGPIENQRFLQHIRAHAYSVISMEGGTMFRGTCKFLTQGQSTKSLKRDAIKKEKPEREKYYLTYLHTNHRQS